MCVIVIAHRVSERYRFVAAANRDEEYDRPSRAAHFWEEDAAIVGGRDVRHGGSWLALTRGGRFAAVTNLRGGAIADGRSRGLLVSRFVTSRENTMNYLSRVAASAHEFAGFHLIAGEIGGDFGYFATGEREPVLWPPGVYGVSNGPPGEEWPKSATLVASVERAMRGEAADAIAGELLGILAARGDANHGGPTPLAELPREIFVVGSRYGTRSSTAIVEDRGELLFVEQNYARGGVPEGNPRSFRFRLDESA